MKSRALLAVAALPIVAPAVGTSPAQAKTVRIAEWRLPDARMAQLQQRWADRLLATYPNATLVQQVVHYGHGTGVGTGGTPRSGTAINWRPNSFTAFGAITPGDSGSGTNTLTGDAVGDNREAAGINTHIYVDSSLQTGLGTFAGTRATQVAGSLANGQIVPYPAPAPVPLP